METVKNILMLMSIGAVLMVFILFLHLIFCTVRDKVRGRRL